MTTEAGLPAMPEPTITPFPGAGPCYFTAEQVRAAMLAAQAMEREAMLSTVETYILDEP